jgi:uncharacterized membrane protein YbhN (UPF0104 family)
MQLNRFFKKRFFFGFIGLAIFAFILLSINIKQTAEYMLSASKQHIVFAAFFALAGTILRSLKWQKIIENYGKPPSLFETTRIFCVGTMIGFLTPLKAGTFVRAFYLKSIGLSKATASILIDRGTELAFVALIAISGSFFFGIKFSIISNNKALLFLAIVAVLCATAWLFGRANKKIAAFTKDLLCLTKNKKTITAIAILTPVPFILSATSYFFVGQSIGINANYSFFFFLAATATVVESLPITFLGLGTREAVIIFLLSKLGKSSELAIALSLLYLVINYSTVCVIGLTKLFSSNQENNKNQTLK